MSEYRTRQVARFRRGTAVLLAGCLMLSMMSGCSLFRSRISGPAPDMTYVEPEPGEHSVPSIWPLGPEWREISSSFGVRRGRSRSHKGIDILAPKGTPVMAAADGEVIFSGNSGRYGKMVVLQHAGGRQTAYAHLDACLAPVGRRVRQGDVIGRVGRTGNASTTHLHYEIREQGRPVNPMKFLPER